MLPVRVVLDTNILISACLKPDGLEAQVVGMVRDGRLAMYATPEIRAEYRDVLLRKKFHLIRGAAEALLAEMEAHAVPCVASVPATAATDEDDNRFLECAGAIGAQYLVTGNLRHFPPSFGPTAVVNSRGLLESLDLSNKDTPGNALQLP